MPAPPTASRSARTFLPAYAPIAVWAAATAVGVAWLAPRAWLMLVLDGWLPAVTLAAAAGWGAWLVRVLRVESPSRTRSALLATALGLGILATAALMLGALGAMSRSAGLVLLGGGVLAGLLRIAEGTTRRPARETRLEDAGSGPRPGSDCTWPSVGLQCLALLPLACPAAILFVGATLPPGILWESEAHGYDVLEYHLQAPREYFDAGRITPLTHNVYASFPQQVEMLYYILMHVSDDPHAAAIPAQLLHAGLAVLAVAALAAWQATRWGAVGAALVGGATPWLACVGSLAYVEAGMLFFAAVACGTLLTPLLAARIPTFGEAVAAGLCAGFAAGCKYQGVLMVAGGLGVAWLIVMRAPAAIRFGRAGVYALAALAAFSPWLIRNAAFTGNPVYPFAYAWFGGAGWSSDQAEQWARGHALAETDRTLAGRFAVARRELWDSELFGPLPLAAGAIGAIVALGRRAAMLAIWTATIVAIWAGLTHMPGRFALPVIVPLAFLAAGIAQPGRAFRGRGVPFPALLLTGMLMAGQALAATGNALALHRLYARHADAWQRKTSIALGEMVGQTEVLMQADPLNALANVPDARLWLVGRADVFHVLTPVHYFVVFNRDPWLAFAENASAGACLDWLRSRNVTHVVFSWSEIRRFRRTYGFTPLVTPEWVEALVAAGLGRLGPTPPAGEAPWLEVFEVPSR